MISVRSNPYYTQEEDSPNIPVLKPWLELIIIHSDGKSYTFNKRGLMSNTTISEQRIIVSPELLQNLITELQLHKNKLDVIRKNSEQLNSLMKHIMTDDEVSEHSS